MTLLQTKAQPEGVAIFYNARGVQLLLRVTAQNLISGHRLAVIMTTVPLYETQFRPSTKCNKYLHLFL